MSGRRETGNTDTAERMRRYCQQQKLKKQKNRNEDQPITSTNKTDAERSRQYRQRKKVKHDQPTTSTNKTTAERSREYRQRQKVKKQVDENNEQPTTSTNNKTVAERNKEYRKRQKLKKQNEASEQEGESSPRKRLKLDEREKLNYTLAFAEFKTRFIKNSFGHVCDICDRLWFKLDLKNQQ